MNAKSNVNIPLWLVVLVIVVLLYKFVPLLPLVVVLLLVLLVQAIVGIFLTIEEQLHDRAMRKKREKERQARQLLPPIQRRPQRRRVIKQRYPDDDWNEYGC